MKIKRIFSGPILAILVLTVILVAFFSIQLMRQKSREQAGSTTPSGQVPETSASGTSWTATATTATSGTTVATEVATATAVATTKAATSTPTPPQTTSPAATTRPPTGATTSRMTVRFITPEQAQSIAIDAVGKYAKLLSIKSELFNHPPKYDVTLTMGGYIYELEVHAVTGAIIDYERNELVHASGYTMPR